MNKDIWLDAHVCFFLISRRLHLNSISIRQKIKNCRAHNLWIVPSAVGSVEIFLMFLCGADVELWKTAPNSSVSLELLSPSTKIREPLEGVVRSPSHAGIR